MGPKVADKSCATMRKVGGCFAKVDEAYERGHASCAVNRFAQGLYRTYSSVAARKVGLNSKMERL